MRVKSTQFAVSAANHYEVGRRDVTVDLVFIYIVSSFVEAYLSYRLYLKLEALGQCIPLPRHVLPVPPCGESV